MKAARAIAESTGARITLTEDVGEGVRGVDFVYTDVWVSMGEPKEVWDERIALLEPYQVNEDVIARHRQPGREVHALPAGVPRPPHRRSARRSSSRPAWTALEVTDEVFESAALDRLRPGREPDAHDQGGHGRHARGLRAAGR